MNHYDSNYASNLDRDEEEQPMDDEPRMIKVRVTVSIDLTVRHRDIEVDAEDWESMDDFEREALCSETRDQLVDWGYEVIDDERNVKADLAKAMLADARKARKRNRK